MQGQTDLLWGTCSGKWLARYGATRGQFARYLCSCPGARLRTAPPQGCGLTRPCSSICEGPAGRCRSRRAAPPPTMPLIVPLSWRFIARGETSQTGREALQRIRRIAIGTRRPWSAMLPAESSSCERPAVRLALVARCCRPAQLVLTADVFFYMWGAAPRDCNDYSLPQTLPPVIANLTALIELCEPSAQAPIRIAKHAAPCFNNPCLLPCTRLSEPVVCIGI